MNRRSGSLLGGAVLGLLLAGCGSSGEEALPDLAFDPGPSPINNDGGYGYGSPGDASLPDLAIPCPEEQRRCAHTFSYVGSGSETAVELRGDYKPSGWISGDAMTYAGGHWWATVPIPWDTEVLYKFYVTPASGPAYWDYDHDNPHNTGSPNFNSILAAETCTEYTCSACNLPPPDPGSGIFDWRDAVIYFVFVDRFAHDPSVVTCDVAGTEDTPYTSTNYMGGNWKGVTQKIDDGYFNDLGVNTLWLTVPLKNADTVKGQGANGDPHWYSAYHGYWPLDPTQVEPCFGSAQDLQDLVDAAHVKGLKVLFDYAMVHVHTSSPIYADHPTWFTSPCVCGAPGCGNFDNYTCWFTDYLAHFDFGVPAARDFSVAAAVDLINDFAHDAFRLDAIKQVNPAWLAALRPEVDALAAPQRFYMVGETYDFQNRAAIRSMIDPATQLDGQFDFPLRIRLVEALLMRSTANMLTPDDPSWSRTAPPGMQGLAEFMDSNDVVYPCGAVMSTFVGNHDLPRSIHYAEDAPLFDNSASDGKDCSSGRPCPWSNQPTSSTNLRAYERLANAFAVILTNRGAPLIYYGDEIGLPGAGDPDNRRMMRFSSLTAGEAWLKTRISALTAIRAAHGALRYGQRQTLEVSADLWVYALTVTGDTVYVAVNRSDAAITTSQLPAIALTELLGGSSFTGPSLEIPARQTYIMVAQ